MSFLSARLRNILWFTVVCLSSTFRTTTQTHFAKNIQLCNFSILTWGHQLLFNHFGLNYLFQLDSFSMFENIYPSADNHVTGIVGLLAAAEALSKYKDDIINNSNSSDILFAFFQGVSILFN